MMARMTDTSLDTSRVITEFNAAFVQHDPDRLAPLVGEQCVMEAVQPAPSGARYEGRAACLDFWRTLAADPTSQFEPEDVIVAGDRATICWSYRFGPAHNDYVRGVNVMRIRDGVIVEALGYTKTQDTASDQLSALVADSGPRAEPPRGAA
jgi:ketosteroid isomerase-like protein